MRYRELQSKGNLLPIAVDDFFSNSVCCVVVFAGLQASYIAKVFRLMQSVVDTKQAHMLMLYSCVLATASRKTIARTA
jgi:hypothetical protein